MVTFFPDCLKCDVSGDCCQTCFWDLRHLRINTEEHSFSYRGADLSALVREASLCALRQEMARQRAGSEKGMLSRI